MDNLSASELLKALAGVAGAVVLAALSWLGFNKKKSSNDVSISADNHSIDYMERASERIKTLETRNDELSKQLAESGIWKVKAELNETRVLQLEKQNSSLEEESKKLRKSVTKMSRLLLKNSIDLPSELEDDD